MAKFFTIALNYEKSIMVKLIQLLGFQRNWLLLGGGEVLQLLFWHLQSKIRDGPIFYYLILEESIVDKLM